MLRLDCPSVSSETLEDLRRQWHQLNEERAQQGPKPKSSRDFKTSPVRDVRKTRLRLVLDLCLENLFPFYDWLKH